MGADTLFMKTHQATLTDGTQQLIQSCCAACQVYLGKQCEHGFRPGRKENTDQEDAFIHCGKQWWGATEAQFTGGTREGWNRPRPANQGSVNFYSGCLRSTAFKGDEKDVWSVCTCVDAASSIYATPSDNSKCGCAPGYQKVGGGTDPLLCASCPTGAYQPAVADSLGTCTLCEAGTYSAAEGATACESCPGSSAVGATTCEAGPSEDDERLVSTSVSTSTTATATQVLHSRALDFAGRRGRQKFTGAHKGEREVLFGLLHHRDWHQDDAPLPSIADCSADETTLDGNQCRCPAGS